MNYTSPANYDDKLDDSAPLPLYQLEGFDKLSVDDYVGEAEAVEDEVLYVTPQGAIVTEDFCGHYEAANPLGEEQTPEWPYPYACPSSASTPDTGLDQPIRELTAEQVRWFYRCDSDKQWVPFSGFDSLRIEERFRRQKYPPHSDQGPNQPPASRSESSNSASTSSMDDSVYYDACSAGSSDGESPASAHKDHLVVRGGMYEVDIEKRKCVSIFWPGEQYPIMRGLWFYEVTWQPLDSDRYDQIENIHLALFANHCISDYISASNPKQPKQVVKSESFNEFRIDWYSPIEVYLYSEAGPSKLVRSFTQKLGYFQKSTGYRLCRGYKTRATLEDRPVDVTHLVFVIHGIGQKMDKDRIIRNTCTFRDCTSWLQTKYFPSSQHRAEFFPVEWRAHLKLDGGIVEAITPNKVQSIRQRLNATAMDIMYYTSPLYSSEIQLGLTCELNRLYSRFTQRNPDFTSRGGKVSVMAHSLGCVIVYDIITGWSITHTLEQRKAQESSNSNLNGAIYDDGSSQASGSSNTPASSQGTTPTPTPTHRPTKLLFELDNLFCMGSPLAVFLALRVRSPQAESCHKDLLPPTLCRRFYNIFHPSDPVAYRMEPLLVRMYAKLLPVQIQAYNAANHTLYEDMIPECIIGDAVASSSQSTATRQGGDEDSPKSPGGTPSRERGWSIWNIVRPWKPQDGSGSPLPSPTRGLEHRLDYVLRDSNLGGPYLSAITSHTDYWRNYDVAYFVLTRLFPDLEQWAVMTSPLECEYSPQSPQSPQQTTPQQATPRVASPPLLQQMLSQVQSQAQSVLQIQAPSLPLISISPTILQRKGSNEAASR
ncbi:Phospholipase DDHD1 [Frankliniella fusca]|uniref:Phospholipase DDHD1 n=1 Tax=Frankliniella fusca TaxID=407009 RepID=A0AAE1LCT2_9NEOP|nr:Phospholipase DDHD1 [Frankliniella fusca]